MSSELGLTVLVAIAEEQDAARPTPPTPEPPQQELSLLLATASYRDSVRPEPEPARVRPYVIAEKYRRRNVR